MAYSEQLAERVRKTLGTRKDIAEKKMMGGLTFMVNGKMCVGVHAEEIMCRIDPEVQDKALKHKGARVMDFTGKPMRGFVFINKEGIKSNKDFEYWINLSLDFNKKAEASKKKK